MLQLQEKKSFQLDAAQKKKMQSDFLSDFATTERSSSENLANLVA